jgi:glutamate racemase
VDALPLPELVEFCEALIFEGKAIIDYFNRKLSEFDLSIYGTIVLGCTHYPFYIDILKKILPNHIQIIDGSSGTLNRLTEVLRSQDQLNSHGNSHTKFLCSSNDPAYIRKMEMALGIIQRKG